MSFIHRYGNIKAPAIKIGDSCEMCNSVDFCFGGGGGGWGGDIKSV